jgi:long-chain fatty acid transport protein
MQHPNKKYPLLAAAITAVLGISTANASGFRIPEISILGLGTSNALVANTDELGALPYNPANMAFHDKNGVVAGVTYIGYDLKVDTTVQGGGPTDSTGEDSFFVPNIYAMAPGYGDWSFGLGINAPFGLETNWAVDTFPNFGPGTAQGAAPELSRIEMINVNPNFAYKIDESTSFAVGLDIYDVRDLALNIQAAKILGSGSGFGWNIGLTKKLGSWNLGLSYRSSVKTDLSGSAIQAAGAIAATSEVEFPDILQFGAHWQATDSFGVELDVERTGWSSFDKIQVDSPAGNITTSTNNWDDAWAVRLGAIFALSPQTDLLLGYSYDETGQTDEYFSARVPDNDRQLFSIGILHDFASWTLEASYMYVAVDDRTFASNTTYVPGVTADPNGTTAYDGTYESSVNLLGIGVSTKF